MNFPPDVEFHEDIRLLIYRPRGVIDEAAVKRIVAVLEELEEKSSKSSKKNCTDRSTDSPIRW